MAFELGDLLLVPRAEVGNVELRSLLFAPQLLLVPVALVREIHLGLLLRVAQMARVLLVGGLTHLLLLERLHLQLVRRRRLLQLLLLRGAALPRAQLHCALLLLLARRVGFEAQPRPPTDRLVVHHLQAVARAVAAVDDAAREEQEKRAMELRARQSRS